MHYELRRLRRHLPAKPDLRRELYLGAKSLQRNLKPILPRQSCTVQIAETRRLALCPPHASNRFSNPVARVRHCEDLPAQLQGTGKAREWVGGPLLVCRHQIALVLTALRADLLKPDHALRVPLPLLRLFCRHIASIDLAPSHALLLQPLPFSDQIHCTSGSGWVCKSK